MGPIGYDVFASVEIRVGLVLRVEAFPEARRAAWKVWVDFGEGVGVRQTSAQVTDLYGEADLVGRLVVGVLNLGEKRIAGFRSEFLLVGFSDEFGRVVLAVPERDVPLGSRLH